MAPKHRPKSKQFNIKDALIRKSVNSKQDQEENNQKEESSSHIIVPKYLRKPNNIRSSESGEIPSYHCSTASRVYFRNNSNLDEIVKEYVEMKKLEDFASYTSGIMRKIVSDPSGKLVYPFITFKFNTLYCEIMARELLIYRKMTDVDKYIKFMNENRLKLCTVNMQNEVHDASVHYIAEKIKARGIKNVRDYRYVAAEKGVRRYFENHAMTKEMYLRDVEWRELSEVSNFGKLIRERLPENATEEDFENEAESVMRQVRQYPPHYDSVLRYLVLNPRYTFIRNMMTEIEEKKIASSIEVFYEKSNAKNILILNPEYTREQVYEMYCSCDSYRRKLPPFHNLYYKPGDYYTNAQYYLNPHNRYRSESETHERNKSDSPQKEQQEDRMYEKQPALLSIHMKTKWRCITNNEIAGTIPRSEIASTEGISETTALQNIQHEIESIQSCGTISASNINNETVVNLQLAKLGDAVPFSRKEVSQIAPEVIAEKPQETVPEYATEREEPFQRLNTIPQRFRNDVKPQDAALKIIKLLTQDKKFIYLAKMELLSAYPDDFNSLWNARKRQILRNFILFSINENLEHLKKIISECPEQQKNNMLQLIDDLIGPPGTSYSMLQKETPNTPLLANIKIERQSNDTENCDPVNVATASSKTCVASVIPVMSNCLQFSPYSSDVEFVERSQQIITVSESQDEAEQFLEELEESAHDQFLKRLNPKKQSIAGTSEQRFSDETIQKLKEFELHSVIDESAEHKSSKRKAASQKPSTSKRKRGMRKNQIVGGLSAR